MVRFYGHMGLSRPGRFYPDNSFPRFLLRHGRASVPFKTVAEQSGFCDVYYFSKLFRRHYALTPGIYRREFMAHDFVDARR